MNLKEIEKQVALGEDSRHQFKVDIRNADSLASEFAAMANSEGGFIFIGVGDDGSMPGHDMRGISRINQLVSNAASHLVRSPISVISENVALGNGRLIMVISVPKGINKPYFDKNGVIWLKSGADKRRVNSREELQRLFQFSDQVHADEVPVTADLNRLDRLRFRDFLKQYYQTDFPESEEKLKILLSNMNLADLNGTLNLAGVLLFAERPEWVKPQFVVKAICYPGIRIHVDTYLDTEDFSGPMHKVYTDSLAFIMRNLHKLQAGGGINSPGKPEIPIGVFEEVLVNALIHRDYFVSAAIRLFIFDDRIEIISPGHLPNNLTIEKIKAGNSNIRNPVLVSFAAKGILPYHGIGSGIKRTLELWPDIQFIDDRDGNQFKVIVKRPVDSHLQEIPASEWSGVATGLPKEKSIFTEPDPTNSSVKTDIAICEILRTAPEKTVPELAKILNLSTRAIEKQLARLKKDGRLIRHGSRRKGWWQVA